MIGQYLPKNDFSHNPRGTLDVVHISQFLTVIRYDCLERHYKERVGEERQRRQTEDGLRSSIGISLLAAFTGPEFVGLRSELQSPKPLLTTNDNTHSKRCSDTEP